MTGKRRKYLELKDARKIAPFKLKAMNYPVMAMEWSRESELHKLLRRLSWEWFESRGYRVGRAKVSAYGCKYYSDYFVVSPSGEFQFVECLTDYSSLPNKLKLLEYAPLWIVVPIDLGKPKNLLGMPRNLRFLFVDPMFNSVVEDSAQQQ